ncbi:glycosyltransferase family 2 protein [Weissella confusa]|uniref:glycosyltransferase family 2 protein n=1 Tax=Weissella confusa TaxID=1583 RepID=UPI002A7495BB|nr:glycosyltransferase family 2 protein [Weissella confusa]MDY2512982.1 glycosyltransferase family 2 protein [Weissella confusa]
MKVSVVIPAYKSGRFVKETVESVLNQNGVEFELFVSLQGPEDGTRETLAGIHDERLHVLDAPAGAAKENWTFVSKQATGEYIKLLPADDVLMPGMLANQVRLLDQNPEAVLTASKREVIDERGSVLKKSWGLIGLSKPMEGSAVIKRVIRLGLNSLGEPGGVLMRRDAFDKAEGWDFSHPYVVDLETYLHVLEFGSFVPDNSVAVKFRVSGTQWTAQLQGQQSAHVIGMNEEFAKIMPKVVTKSVLFQGNAMAKMMELARMTLYKLKK